MILNINNYIESEVLPKLRKVRATSDGWGACCPAHEDENPSLSIAAGDGGKILLYCHAGCSFVQLVQALRLNEREQRANGFQFKYATEKKRIVAKYDYTDEDGEVLYQIVRYEPKGFGVRRPDGNGGWNWGLDGSRRVIYQLPQILATRESDTNFVVLCEGEKDADNVARRLDFPATTIPLGVNAWREEFAEFFAGLNVIILPDNDEAGRRFAETAAKSLIRQADSVRVVQLPDLPEKGDVSDWLEKGGSNEQFIDLVTQTEEWQPRPETENADGFASENNGLFVIKSVNDWISEAIKKPVPRMLFGEFWFEGEICIMFADTNAGKSIVAVQIANSITKGQQIGSFAMQAEAQKVLYFDFELTDRQFINRYAEQEYGFYINQYQFHPDFLRVEVNPDNYMPDGKDYDSYLAEELEKAIIETESKIIVIDNITFLRGENERAQDALPLMKHLKALKQKHNLSILVLAHTPKRDETRPLGMNDLQGSKMLMNFCDSSVAIGKSVKDQGFRYLKQIKERNTSKIYDSEYVPVAQVTKHDNFLMFEFIGFDSEKEHLRASNQEDKGALLEQVRELMKAGTSQREMARILDISVGKVNGLVQEIKTSEGVHNVQNVQSSVRMNNVNIVNNQQGLPMEE